MLIQVEHISSAVAEAYREQMESKHNRKLKDAKEDSSFCFISPALRRLIVCF